jgi:small subunit ribosomal protein S8
MTYSTDPIGDLLTRMRNAQGARHTTCRAPWSRLKEQLLQLMKHEGWIANVMSEGEGVRRELVVTFNTAKPPLTLKRISKPGRRVYQGSETLTPILRGLGISVLTTNQGVMTDRDARKKKVGGEVLCTIS